ncbi:MAG: porin, partial [Lysobacterales bacterium]
CAWFAAISAGAACAESPPSTAEGSPSWFSRGPKGFEIGSPDGNWFANLDLRVQSRYTWSEVEQPAADGDGLDTEDELEINRARLKIGGNAGRPWLGYYYEHDLVDNRVLDLRVTVERWDALQLRFGQWKIPYNRERIDSSGSQQFVDRSIATPAFTLDRQRGGAVFGRLFEGTRADSWYNVGVYEPLGRDGRGDYDEPLLLARWQWNFLGRDLGFSQGDLGYRERPAASLALAAASYRGPYTAFSSSGGGQLDGFDAGGPGRYDVEQFLVETAWQYRGWSWQQEWHRKEIVDTEAGRTTVLDGGYAQAGVFPHTFWAPLPKPLEVAARYAQVDPDDRRGDDLSTETSIVVNWFFDGHRNKLSADLSWLEDELAAPGQQVEERLRLQWDVSL